MVQTNDFYLLAFLKGVYFVKTFYVIYRTRKMPQTNIQKSFGLNGDLGFVLWRKNSDLGHCPVIFQTQIWLMGNQWKILAVLKTNHFVNSIWKHQFYNWANVSKFI